MANDRHILSIVLCIIAIITMIVIMQTGEKTKMTQSDHTASVASGTKPSIINTSTNQTSQPQTEPPPQISTTSWKTYTDPEYGFQIAYPGEYIIATPPVQQFGYDVGLKKVVDFYLNGKPLFRILIENLLTHFADREQYFSSIRKTTLSTNNVVINGAPALEAYSCGRAACLWSVSVVKGTMLFKIVPFVEIGQEKPMDTVGLPLRSIIDSFQLSNK